MKYLQLAICIQLTLIGAVPAGVEEHNLASEFKALPLAQQTVANLPKGREQETLQGLIEGHSRGTLLRLDHAPTVEDRIGKYIESKGKHEGALYDIKNSGAPQLIARLAHILYKSDELQRRNFGESASDYGESAAAAELIGNLVVKSPQFKLEVKEWAKNNILHVGPNCIQLARQFWETNVEALETRKFSEVVVPEVLVYANPQEQKGFGKPEGEKSTPPAVLGQASAPPKKIHPQTGPSEELVYTPFWLIVGLLLVIGICALRNIKSGNGKP